MTPRLAWNGYGKAAVRLVKVDRGAARHELHDLTVDVQLQGDFGPTHTVGDNSEVLPTDTMKNTVYALARQGPVDPPEEFGERLARHFLAACPAARRAVVGITVNRWDRASVGHAPHDHAFVRGPAEGRLATVTVDDQGVGVEAGIQGLGLLKTTGSAFTGFLRDEYTTLRETDDRILGHRRRGALAILAATRRLRRLMARGARGPDRDLCPARVGLGAAHALCDGGGGAGLLRRDHRDPPDPAEPPPPGGGPRPTRPGEPE